jgi:ABC-type bacteriocin/lantibiotic exporter with double-glycine peptidase domain
VSDESKKQWTMGGISAVVALMVSVPTIIFASGATWQKVNTIEVRQERVESLYNQKSEELSAEMRAELARLTAEYKETINDIRIVVDRIDNRTRESDKAISKIEGRLNGK